MLYSPALMLSCFSGSVYVADVIYQHQHGCSSNPANASGQTQAGSSSGYYQAPPTRAATSMGNYQQGGFRQASGGWTGGQNAGRTNPFRRTPPPAQTQQGTNPFRHGSQGSQQQQRPSPPTQPHVISPQAQQVLWDTANRRARETGDHSWVERLQRQPYGQ